VIRIEEVGVEEGMGNATVRDSLSCVQEKGGGLGIDWESEGR